MENDPFLADARYWDTLHAEPVVADVLTPVLKSTMPEEVRRAGPWTAARWAISHVDTDAFTHQLTQHYTGPQNNGLTMSGKRRARMLAVPTAAAIAMESSAPEGNAAAVITSAVKAARAFEQNLQEWAAKPTNPRLLISSAEAEAILPLMLVWQAAGPAVRRLTRQQVLTSQEKDAVQGLLRFTVEHLPERKPRPWMKVEPSITHEISASRMHLGSWVGYGAFDLDPLENPVTRGAAWSAQFTMEPLVRGFGRTIEAVAATYGQVSRLLSVDMRHLEADERGVLENLRSDQSAYNAATYFSPNVSLAVAANGREIAPQREGVDLTAPLRTRALRAVFDAWTQKLAEKGTPLTADHMLKRAGAARHFDSESWKEINQVKLGPTFDYTAANVFNDPEPWGDQGRARVLSQLGPMLQVREQILGILLNCDPQTPKAALRDKWVRLPDLGTRVRELHALKLVHRLEPLGPNDSLPRRTKDSEAYWRRVLTSQPNPYCGLAEPENLLRGMMPNAHYRRLQAVVASIWPAGAEENAATFALREALCVRIWQTACRRVERGAASHSVEEVLLGAALEVSKSSKASAGSPAFGPEHAYAVAFSIAMGTGGEPRLPDLSVAAQKTRGRVLNGLESLTMLVGTGGAAVATQLVVDLQSCVKVNGGDASRNPRVVALDRALTRLKREVELVSGRAPLGSALKRPEVWAKILPKTSEWALMVDSIVAQPNKRPEQVAKETLPVGMGPSPVLTAELGEALREISTHGQMLQTQNVEKRPAATLAYDWAEPVLTTGVDAIAPMLDAFAIGEPTQSFRPMISQVAIIEAAGQQAKQVSPKHSASMIYAERLSEWTKEHPQHPIGGPQPAASQAFPYANAIPRFLEAEGKDPSGVLALLSQRSTVLDPESARAAGNAIYRVFQANRLGVLGNNAQAVVWAAVFSEALREAKTPGTEPLLNALSAFLDTHERVSGDRSPRNKPTTQEHWSRIDEQYATAAAGVRAALKQSFTSIRSQTWWHLRANALGAVHHHFQRESRELERVHMGPDAIQKAQVSMLSAAYSGIVNAHRFAVMYVKDPSIARPKPLARSVASVSSPELQQTRTPPLTVEAEGVPLR